MKCPSCAGQMVSESYGGIDIDVCQTCSGVWFDEGELSKFVHLDPATQHKLDEEHADEPENVNHLKRLCPNCQQVLESYRYAYKGPVVIDCCPSGHGVFVDQGELPQIEKFIEDSEKDDPKAAFALATADLEFKAKQSRERAAFLARSVWMRRMSGSYAWWQLGLLQDKF